MSVALMRDLKKVIKSINYIVLSISMKKKASKYLPFYTSSYMVDDDIGSSNNHIYAVKL